MTEAAPPPTAGSGYQTGYAGTAPAARTGSGMAIAALVLGLLSLPATFTVIGGILLGLLAIIFGVIAVRRFNRGQGGGKGMAIAGIVTGALGLVLSIILIAVGVSLLNSSAGKNYQSCVKQANGDQSQVQQCAQKFQHDLQHNN